MEESPSTPAERAEPLNLTIDAPATPQQPNLLHIPPSPSSLAGCSTTQATAPTPSTNPPPSPAWEGGRGNEHQPVQAHLALSPAGADRGLPFLIRPPTTPALHPTASPVPANAAGPQAFSAANLRPDLMPPGARAAQHPGAAAAATAAATSPRTPPSPAGPSEINDDTTSSAPTRPGFFGTPSTNTPTMHTPIPPSPSSADMSGIFHLDLDSPLAGQATPRDGEDETAAEDRVQDSAEEHEAAAVSAAESSPSQAPASTSSNAGAVLSPGFSVPWGRVAPSPDSSDALQGPWGRLQEVCVCV